MRKKIFIIITIITTLITVIPNLVFADEVDGFVEGSEEVIPGVDGLGILENYKGTNPDSTELTSMVGNILGVIRAVGTVVSVVILIGIGIRYLLGSVEEKADYKKSLIPYIVGAAILFTGTTIPQLIYELVNEI